MRRSSSRFTSGVSSTPRTTLKMAALAPMPSPSVMMTASASPLAPVSDRTPTRMSRAKSAVASNQRLYQTWRTDSRTCGR